MACRSATHATWLDALLMWTSWKGLWTSHSRLCKKTRREEKSFQQEDSSRQRALSHWDMPCESDFCNLNRLAKATLKSWVSPAPPCCNPIILITPTSNGPPSNSQRVWNPNRWGKIAMTGIYTRITDLKSQLVSVSTAFPNQHDAKLEHNNSDEW